MRRCGSASVALLSCLTVVSCAPDRDGSATPPTRPAARVTCEAVALGPVPADLELVDRTLEPLGGPVSGQVLEYRNGRERSIVVTAGGSLDDAIEAYDDLRPDGEVARDGVTVHLLVGEFLERPVRAALWRDTSLQPPCDGRAVVAEGLTGSEFSDVLRPRATQP